MAKFKPVKGKKAKARGPAGAIPCVLLVVMGIVLLSLLFWAILKSS